MAFVITGACTDLQDRSCLEECPVDCIYEGDRKMYINPIECIDCGACEQVCPVNAAINPVKLAGTGDEVHIADNAVFFETVLPGRDAPLGTPGGASRLGRIGTDTPLVGQAG
jgi:NAD-dependent dihydropyrimidine dehydrogenase PreA subunit